LGSVIHLNTVENVVEVIPQSLLALLARLLDLGMYQFLKLEKQDAAGPASIPDKRSPIGVIEKNHHIPRHLTTLLDLSDIHWGTSEKPTTFGVIW
jgi:hypothetical protein